MTAFVLQGGSVSAEHEFVEQSVAGGSVLLIEDNPIDALRTMALLRRGAPDMSCRHVSSLAEATPELLDAADCVILDLSLPDAQEQEGLKEILHRSTDVPVVVLTGNDDPLTSGVASLRNGAQDYLTKDDLDATALERSIRYAIERQGFQVHLAAAAVLAATAAAARTEAISAADVATSAQSGVEAFAAVASAAAVAAVAAVDHAVAIVAAEAADSAALAAVLGATKVADTARAAAAAAADAAIMQADAFAADATASAAIARDAAEALSSGSNAAISEVKTRSESPSAKSDDGHLDQPTTLSRLSTGLVFTAKIAAVTMAILTLMLFFSVASAG